MSTINPKRRAVTGLLILLTLARLGHGQRLPKLMDRGVTDDWVPQPVTKAKFTTYVTEDQRRFIEENRLPPEYAERRLFVAKRLSNVLGDALEKQRVVLDKESLDYCLEIVSKASGRSLYDVDDVRTFQSNAALIQLVQEAAKTAVTSGGFRYITSRDVQGALLRICPLYPVC